MLGRQFQIGGALQLAAFEQRGDASAQGTRHPLTGDDRQVGQLAAQPLQVLTLRQFADQLLIGQLRAAARAVDQHDALEALPHIEVLQDRQERRQPGAGGQQPEVASVGETVQGQEAERLLVDQQLVARFEAAQLAGEFAIGHHDGEEIEKLVVRCRDHRVGAPDDGATGLAHPQPRELPGREAKARVARGAQGEQGRRQGLYLEQTLAGELLFADGHTSLPLQTQPGEPVATARRLWPLILQSVADKHHQFLCLFLKRPSPAST